jgi:hypothetical protein
MTRAPSTLLLALALLAALAGSAAGEKAPKKPKAPHIPPVAPVADSVTIALWRFDENGGTRAADTGPFHLDGAAGIDTRTDFGRYRSARLFGRSVDSWVAVPYSPSFENHPGFTVEAWVRVDSLATYELSVIAARWTPAANQQGWVLGVTGHSLHAPVVNEGPDWFQTIVGLAPPQRLVFGYQPALAGAPIGFSSIADLPIGRWAHVAATLDGQVVKLYVDGKLDSQFATSGTIRPTEAPLLMGSTFDPRHLTSFGGDLRMDPNASVTVYYPFVGALDEVRLSGVARTLFESAPPR